MFSINSSERSERPQLPKLPLRSIAIAGGVAILLWNVFHTVPTGYRGVVTQFGKIVGIEGEGLVILPPWQKLNIFNVRAETTPVDKAEGGTSDMQPVHVGLSVRYAIKPDKVAEVFEKYSRNGDLSSYVETATQEIFKAVTARYTAPDLIAKRPEVSKAVLFALNEKLATYGAHVVNIDMTNFSFGPDYMKAINRKATQEQERLAEENKQRTVEAQERQKVIIAEAAASAAKATADGEAYAKTTVAKAEAEALRVTNAAIRESKDVLELERIKVEAIKAGRWDGKLPQQMTGSVIPFMRVEKPAAEKQ